MPIKPTIIGAAAAPQAGSKLAPTRLGGSGAGGVVPTQPAPPAQPAMRPTAFKPTAMPSTVPAPAQAPAVQPTSMAKPTAMPSRPPAPAPAPAEPLRASVLPGTQRKPLEVSYEQLAQRFPGTDVNLLERARAILAGVSLHTNGAASWLSFGVQAQEAVTGLVLERVSAMETSPTRDVTTHLARMQLLLSEVLDAMDGGFFKKPASAVWASVAGEVRQLETLLRNAGPKLSEMLVTLSAMEPKLRDAGEVLQAHALAALYLVDVAGSDAANLLVSRATALTQSQALVLEQQQMLALATTNVQELITLVQNGVLLQLPAVYSQLAGLPTKPSDTERYLATEKLNEIVNFMKRKA